MALEATDRAGDGRLDSGNQQDQSTDREALRSAKELIQFLIKTTRTLRIYLHNNPIHQRFISELKEKFEQHLDRYGDLKIRVRQHELVMEQEVLYENQNRMESIAFRLYIDGIRQIAFHPGLEQNEIVDFLEAIGKDSGQILPDDDVATLLWEKGLKHITYQVAEDYQQQLRIELGPQDEGRISGALQTELQAGPETTKDEMATDMGQGLMSGETKYQDLAYTAIYTLSQEEVAKLKHEMQTEEDQDLLAELIQILMAILEIEKESNSFREVIKLLQEMLDLMIHRGDFFHARRIMEVFWELQSPARQMGEEMVRIAREAVDWAGEGDRIDRLRSVLNSEETKDLDHLYAYLILHNKNAISPLINLLGSLSRMKSRRILCEAMIELARNDAATLIGRLRDRKWYVVRNIVYILGKIGNEQAVDPLVAAIRHPEARVRKEVLRAYELLPGPRAKSYLLRFLKDPDSSIRILAAKSAAQFNIAGAAEQILECINAAGFEALDLYEKKEMFDALGRVGGKSIVPHMEKILKRSAWFRWHKGRIEELKLCAVIALKRLKGPEAIAVLKQGLALRNKTVRDACARVLNELQAARS